MLSERQRAIVHMLSDRQGAIAHSCTSETQIETIYIHFLQTSNLFVEALETGKKWTPNNKIKCQANSIVKVVTIL